MTIDKQNTVEDPNLSLREALVNELGVINMQMKKLDEVIEKGGIVINVKDPFLDSEIKKINPLVEDRHVIFKRSLKILSILQNL